MKAAIGVDIGGTDVKLGIVRHGQVLVRRSFPTASISSGPKALEEGIVAAVRSLRGSFRGKVESVGVGVPGLVRVPQGIVQTCANVKGWKNVPLQSRLRRRLGVPVRVDNDVHAMALAEWRYGAGRGVRNLVCVTLGTGVGGGFILNGKLYRSRLGPSAEIGHVAIGETGPACSCGGSACLERYVGNRDLLRILRRKLESGAKSRLPRLAGGRLDRITPEMVDRACEMGDRLAIETWEEAGCKIGLVLSKVVTLLSPDRIVIGGGLSRAGRWLFEPIRKTLRERAMHPLGKIPVVPAKLGMSAGLIGAALLGQEALNE
ncbi:MAG: ROK family protein [Candidatus Omnitrophota bacterium]|nr:ROK family protein [Candidatus Omnitrophota bacterium]